MTLNQHISRNNVIGLSHANQFDLDFSQALEFNSALKKVYRTNANEFSTKVLLLVN